MRRTGQRFGVDDGPADPYLSVIDGIKIDITMIVDLEPEGPTKAYDLFFQLEAHQGSWSFLSEADTVKFIACLNSVLSQTENILLYLFVESSSLKLHPVLKHIHGEIHYFHYVVNRTRLENTNRF